MGNADLTKKRETTQGGVKIPSGFSTFSSQDGDSDPQEYARLLELYDTSFRNLAEGEVVKGTVVKVTPTEVIVDVGFKSEGIIPIEEFIDENGAVNAQPGDSVDVAHRRLAFRVSNSVTYHECQSLDFVDGLSVRPCRAAMTCLEEKRLSRISRARSDTRHRSSCIRPNKLTHLRASAARACRKYRRFVARFGAK